VRLKPIHLSRLLAGNALRPYALQRHHHPLAPATSEAAPVSVKRETQHHASPCLPAGLVFDCDGTLLHTMHHHWAAWEQTARENGISLTPEQLLSLAGKPTKAIMELLVDEQGLQGVDIDAAVQRKQDLYVEQAHQTEPIHEVLDIAKAAKARGTEIPLGEHALVLWEGRDREFCRQDLQSQPVSSPEAVAAEVTVPAFEGV